MLCHVLPVLWMTSRLHVRVRASEATRKGVCSVTRQGHAAPRVNSNVCNCLVAYLLNKPIPASVCILQNLLIQSFIGFLFYLFNPYIIVFIITMHSLKVESFIGYYAAFTILLAASLYNQ